MLPEGVRRARADRGRLGRPARGAAGDAARPPARGGAGARLGRLRRRRDARWRSPWRRTWRGSRSPTPPIAVISEAQLFGRARPPGAPAQARRGSGSDPARPARPESRRAGRARGVRRRTLPRAHADGDRRPARGVPGARVPGRRPHLRAGAALHLVSRYTGAAPENAPLHKLGTDQWARARKRAAEQIRDVAAELLDLYARRKAQQGLALPVNEHDYQAFASAFPFEETEDQAEAIRAGAGGPGQRAADGPHRVRRCRLRQDRGGHARRLRRRAGRQAGGRARARPRCWCSSTWPTSATASPTGRCAWRALSRFGSSKETAAILEGLEQRQGRHRHRHASPAARARALQGPGPAHHRRGASLRRARQAAPAGTARQRARAHPHRHAHPAHAQHGARAACATCRSSPPPPAARLAIKTFLIEWHAPTLREAALRELRRGGQIYFVHNEVRTIDKIAARTAGAGAGGDACASATARCASATSSS